uniref:Uncharacterized protein n=1 Tax=Solanum lycopersicum TaxID=4081 RepID=A0A3Q7GG25_SOLLC
GILLSLKLVWLKLLKQRYRVTIRKMHTSLRFYIIYMSLSCPQNLLQQQ